MLYLSLKTACQCSIIAVQTLMPATCVQLWADIDQKMSRVPDRLGLDPQMAEL